MKYFFLFAIITLTYNVNATLVRDYAQVQPYELSKHFSQDMNTKLKACFNKYVLQFNPTDKENVTTAALAAFYKLADKPPYAENKCHDIPNLVEAIQLVFKFEGSDQEHINSFKSLFPEWSLQALNNIHRTQGNLKFSKNDLWYKSAQELCLSKALKLFNPKSTNFYRTIFSEWYSKIDNYGFELTCPISFVEKPNTSLPPETEEDFEYGTKPKSEKMNILESYFIKKTIFGIPQLISTGKKALHDFSNAPNGVNKLEFSVIESILNNQTFKEFYFYQGYSNRRDQDTWLNYTLIIVDEYDQALAFIVNKVY